MWPSLYWFRLLSMPLCSPVIFLSNPVSLSMILSLPRASSRKVPVLIILYTWDQDRGLVMGTWSINADSSMTVCVSGSNSRSVHVCVHIRKCTCVYTHAHALQGGYGCVFKMCMNEPTCTYHRYRFMQWYAGKFLTMSSSLRNNNH